ncbi:MAG: HNH endonuclease [Anaerolineales bacterium]|nr:HNH endonuclease [Anaerolineales bacterium]
MSDTSIKPKNKFILWGKAAGRCEYEGCNQPLWLDLLTKVELNTSYIAHIIADKSTGPRGDSVLSEKLKNDISNLMLLCDVHHRLIDVEDISGHSVERLRGMKRDHEERIDILTSIMPEKRSHILLYGANIGKHNAKVSWIEAALAMTPDRYPARREAFELGLTNNTFQDNEEKYWRLERENLQRQFDQKVKPNLQLGNVGHFSIFAFAPQPLLIELGRLLSDIPAADVYQLHREPKQNWNWQESPVSFDYIIKKPNSDHSKVAIILSLSATIDEKRITDVVGEDVSIWTVTVDNPNNDFLKSREQLVKFRELLRKLFDEIKAKHGHGNVLHVFPAVPVAIAVEIGRVWMPKADLPLLIYDENRGFSLVLTID